MIIHDFHISCARNRPAEADSELIVNANAVLTRPVPLERLEAITGWNAKIIKSACDLQLSQLAPRSVLNTLEPLDSVSACKRCSFGIPK